MQLKSGIYKITNIINNKIYIGSSKNILNRIWNHKTLLRNNNHPNKKLQNSFNKYKEVNFKFEIVEYCKIEELIIKEQNYIDGLNPYFNILKIAYSSLGYKYNQEQRNKMNVIKYKNGSIKLCDEIVIKIIKDINLEKSSNEIANKYNINVSIVSSIKYGKAWKHLSNLITFNNRIYKKINKSEKYLNFINNLKGENALNSKLREFEVIEILDLINKKYKLKEIANLYKIKISTISEIKQNRTWKHIKRIKNCN